MLISLPVIVNLQVGHAEQLPVKSYTIADGLARDYINRIKQDRMALSGFARPKGSRVLTGMDSLTMESPMVCRIES